MASEFSTSNRVITPTILQMEATECGAAALAIVLAYYKRFVSLEELRIACGVSRDGSKAVNMLRAARQYGFQAQGAKADDLEALSGVKLPIIAFWEFNHFVVIEGMDSKVVYINDPANGPRTITYDEFNRSFTGIILTFEPTSGFKSGGQPETLWHSLEPRLRGIKDALIYIIIASLALVIPGIIIPGFTKVFIDDVLINHISGWLVPLLWGMALTALLRAALTWVQQSHLLRLQLKISIAASTRFFWHVLRLPFSFFSQRYAGDIASRVESNDHVATILSGELSTSIVSLFSMVFFAIIMFLYDWQLTIIGILVALANGGILYLLARKLENYSRRFVQEAGKLSGIEMSGLQAIETIKASGGESDFFQRWAGNHAKTLNSQQKIHFYNQILIILPTLLSGLTTVIVLGLGGWHIIQGYLTIGALVAFQSLLASFEEPLLTILGLGSELQEIRGELARLDDVFRHPEDPRLNIHAATPTTEKLQGQLELRNISFGYSPLEPPLLENISLNLTSGSRIAVVGTSGSGKSTLAKVVCGLYQPWSGEILLDSHPLPDIPPALLSHTLSFVDQDIFLFEGSIRNNLTLWNKTIATEDIEDAVQDAVLKPVIASRPGGLESQITTDGTNFSGGQRQQLEIARALATKPSLLILDEATAALDANTEFEIMENLKQRKCSMLIIAHRLSTIRDCDEIIVLEHGKIVERGKHDDLYQKKGAYHRLLEESEEHYATES